MKELLTQLPTELGSEKSKIRVGFITYDTTVHFYNIKVKKKKKLNMLKLNLDKTISLEHERINYF